MATPNNPKSIFPDLPREIPVITKNGDFAPLWSLGLSSLFQALQENFKNEGILFPALTATNIADIQVLYTPYIGLPRPNTLPDISGQTVFDSTNRVSKQFVITYDNSNPPNILCAQWNILAYIILGAGSPSGVQAGNVSWQYFDTVGANLYICTTNGSASSAIWTEVN